MTLVAPRFAVLCAALAVSAASAYAQDPLHAQIDRMIEAKAKADGVAISPLADDAEFLRRVYLDFAGRIPPVDIVKAFLADTDRDKRIKLIDKLLGSSDYPTRMADLFDVMLMERLGEHTDWTKYLRDSFAANKPWDTMAREMIRADAKNAAAAGASFFLAKRLENYGQNPVDYSGLTRDVGRLFLGKNLQCCECHDHLSVTDYKQQHFQGLHAFFKNAYLVKGASNQNQVGERATTDKTSFASVFTKVMMMTAPAVPGGMMVEIPSFPKGEEFAVKPDKAKKVEGVPKFSTLAAASEQIPNATNKDFSRNMANRLWFMLVGRGIVHPLDLHHSGNLGSHPELLDLLADEFVAHQFDMKWLLREIALTGTYQRSSVVAKGAEPPEPQFFAAALEKRLTAEQLLLNTLIATETDPKAADKLRPKFLKAYANEPREPEDEIAPSLKAALFVLHDESVLALFKPSTGNLTDRLVKLPDEKIADELYLTVLSRKPTADEAETVSKVLAKNAGKKPEAVGRMVWALVASMEFGVNH